MNKLYEEIQELKKQLKTMNKDTPHYRDTKRHIDKLYRKLRKRK